MKMVEQLEKQIAALEVEIGSLHNTIVLLEKDMRRKQQEADSLNYSLLKKYWDEDKVKAFEAAQDRIRST